MVRCHGPLIRPHYPRRNQCGPVWGLRAQPGYLKLVTTVGVRELVRLGVGFAVGVHSDGCDFLLSDRAILHAGLGGSDCVHNIHTGGYLTEGCVLTIQVLCILVHDKELAACAVGAGGTSHRQNAALMAQIVLEAVKEELALDAVAGAAHAGAVGAAALDHKAGDNAVENQAVVEIMVCQVDEIIHALGCDFGVQFALDNAAVFHSDLKSGIHNQYLSFIALSI